ncbi:hypothetical protein M422DRAFT_84764, partial [Sphaerobolus stellatus SS14]
LTSPGEKQYYALTLIERLFTELPNDWHVGLLYDITCQIQRSMVKWGFLKEYFPCMAFAVSVFHAFRHQWECQLRGHPRKIEGFRLTDGEGCGHFWSNIKRLIPSLRISGPNRRRLVLDPQFHHMKKDTLRNLALNIKKKRVRAKKAMREAKAILKELAIDEDVLRQEWKDQVQTQTAKLDRQDKNKADKALERILSLREERDDLHLCMCMLWETRWNTLKDNLETLMCIDEDLSSAQQALESTTKVLHAAEKALGLSGAEAKARLRSLKGNELLRYQMNARVLKNRICSKVIAQRFERGRLEKAYR